MNLFTLTLLLSAFAGPHDDDPKRADRVPPFQGQAWRRGPALAQFSGGSESFITGGGPTSPGYAFEAEGVQLLSWLPLSEFGNGAPSGNDCWGYVSPSGREYAIMGTSNGTGFVEVTDPGDAQVVGFIPGPVSLWRDIKTYDQYAYAVSEGGGGIQVIDLSGIDSGVVTHVNSVTSGGTDATHNVVIDEDSGYLYRCGGANRGLRIYRLHTNPQNPAYVGSWDTRYVHDAQIVTMTSGPYAGQELAFCCSGYNGGSTSTGLDILNVTNKNNVTVIKNVFYTPAAYSHQGWLSADKSLFYLGDELDESGFNTTRTHIIDVSDPGSSQSLGYFTNQSSAVGHNLYTLGDTIYAANYRSGLRIFDASDPLAPAEVAWFDVWPEDDEASFNGLWSCYPYLPSGVVLGSDMEKGLFVWWVGDPLVDISVPTGAPLLVSPAGEAITVNLSELSSGDLDEASPRLWWDAGAGWQSSALTHQSGEEWSAALPSLECGTDFTWFLSASSTNGVLWTHPQEAPVSSLLSTSAASETVLLETNFETASGFTSGSWDDDATQGQWVLGTPTAAPAQPSSDHSEQGTRCWYTGEGSDVDGGRTSLVSPTWDLRDATDPVLSFWLYLNMAEGNASLSDHARVQISDNGGITWTTMELLIRPEPETIGVWLYYHFHLADYISLDAPVKVRVRANDLNLDSIVEAAVDDLRLVDLGCDCPDGGSLPDCGCTRSTYCEASQNSLGVPARISSSGSLSVTFNDLSLQVVDAPPSQFGLFFYGAGQATSPFGDGTLCVSSGGLGLFRLGPPAQTTSAGSLTRALDWNAPPSDRGPGAATPGSSWNYQLWYRDPAGPGGTGFNLSDALSVTLCP
ncbi:MAG: choice-of-anchor B family protein [Planctomycetes bacterium]|nr:choice-of-anchor B family protein [Planctomycetota bacterium]